MIYITIPVFNRKNLLRDCLLSFREQTNKNFRIIVTDDGSTDGTELMLKTEFPDVIVLKGDGNLWWTGAINLAVNFALDICKETDNLLILNDDLVVPENYIENFYLLSEDHPNTLIGSVVTDIENRDIIHSGGVKINWLTAKFVGVNTGKRLSSFNKGYFADDISILTGRGVLIPSKVFRELGNYNEKHYKQCGDPELPRRAQKAGFKLIVSYDVPVYSYVKDEGHINHLDKFNLNLIKGYFTDIRSNMNLRYRFWFAMDGTSNKLHGIWFFCWDLIRISGRFVKHLALK